VPDPASTKQITVVVKDDSGQPQANATLTIDGQASAKTDSKGQVVFNHIAAGEHTIMVKANNETVVKTVKLDAKMTAMTVTVNMPKQSWALLQIIFIVVGGLAVAGLLGFGIWDLRKFRLRKMQPAMATATVHTSDDGPAVDPMVAAVEAEVAASQVISPTPPASEETPEEPPVLDSIIQAAEAEPAPAPVAPVVEQVPLPQAPVAPVVEQAPPAAQAPEPVAASTPTPVPVTPAPQPVIPSEPIEPLAAPPVAPVNPAPVPPAAPPATPQAPPPPPQPPIRP
jgi:hypothetical protein